MWFKKSRLETPFIGDNVKTFIKMSNCENLVLYISKNVQKIAAFAMFFWFSVTKQSPKNGFGFPNDQKYPCYPLVLKFNITLARLLLLVILYFACISMTANQIYDLMWMGSSMQNNF